MVTGNNDNGHNDDKINRYETIGTILFAKGGQKIFQTRNGKKPSLAELKGIVGGYISLHRLNLYSDDPNYVDFTLVVNEEALPRNLHVNLKASEIAQCHIAGDVLLIETKKL